MSLLPAEGANFLPARHVPQLDRLVKARREQLLAVRAQGHSINGFLMPLKRGNQFLRLVRVLCHHKTARAKDEKRRKQTAQRGEGRGHHGVILAKRRRGGKVSVATAAQDVNTQRGQTPCPCILNNIELTCREFIRVPECRKEHDCIRRPPWVLLQCQSA